MSTAFRSLRVSLQQLLGWMRSNYPAPSTVRWLFPSILIGFLGLKIAEVYLEGKVSGLEIIGRALERRLDDISWWVLFTAAVATMFIWRSAQMLIADGKRKHLKFSFAPLGLMAGCAWSLVFGATYLANVRGAGETFWYSGPVGIMAIQWIEGALNLLAIVATGYWIAVMVSVVWWTRNSQLREALPKTARFVPDGILKTVFAPILVGSLLWGLYAAGLFKLMQEMLGWNWYPFIGRSGWSAIGFCFLGCLPFILVWLVAILIWMPDLRLRATSGVPPFNAQFRGSMLRK